MASYVRPRWCPGAVRGLVMATAKRLSDYEIPVPPLRFYETLAERAEEISNEAIAETIDASANDPETVVANLSIVRGFLDEIDDNIFLATEAADDPMLARLAAYLIISGTDGYNNLIYDAHWGGHCDPEWGTIWALHQNIRDFTPAFLFKVCLRGDCRFLAVECHSPRRRLPNDPHARLRARTMSVSGVPVLAFSPAEIEADTAACVSEIESALGVLAQELLALTGKEQPPCRDFRPRA